MCDPHTSTLWQDLAVKHASSAALSPLPLLPSTSIFTHYFLLGNMSPVAGMAGPWRCHSCDRAVSWQHKVDTVNIVWAVHTRLRLNYCSPCSAHSLSCPDNHWVSRGRSAASPKIYCLLGGAGGGSIRNNTACAEGKQIREEEKQERQQNKLCCKGDTKKLNLKEWCPSLQFYLHSPLWAACELQHHKASVILPLLTVARHTIKAEMYIF